MSLSPHVRIRLLVNRACQDSVLEPNNVGVIVHALRVLGSFSVENAPLMHAVGRVAEKANARSQCNILHTIAYTMREQYDTHTAPSTLQMSLIDTLQQGIERSVQTLTPPECVLASEALIALQPWGCIHPELMALLQERTSTLTPFVQRPIELIGLVRVAVEAMYTPMSGVSDADRDVAAANWETELSDLVMTISMNLPAFRKQDLITLMDALIIRGARPLELTGKPASSSGRGRQSTDYEPQFLSAEEEMEETAETYRFSGGGGGDLLEGSSDAARHVPPPCQPLVKAIVDRVVETSAEMSASQLCAWLHRLSLIGWYEHPAFMTVVRSYHAALTAVSSSSFQSPSPSTKRNINASSRKSGTPEAFNNDYVGNVDMSSNVSTSQLATAGHALSQLLLRDMSDTSARNEGEYSMQNSNSSSGSTSSGNADVSSRGKRTEDVTLKNQSGQDTLLTRSDRQVCSRTLCSIVELQAALAMKTFKCEGAGTRSATKAAMDIYRLIVALPLQCCNCNCNSSTSSNAYSHSTQSCSLSRGDDGSPPASSSSFLTAVQYQQIPPEILARSVGHVLAYAESELSPRQLTTLISRVFMWRIQRYAENAENAQSKGMDSASDTHDITSRVRACVATKLELFNAHDLLQMMNEIATAAYEDDALGSSRYQSQQNMRGAQPSVQSSNRGMRQLFMLLHNRAQSIRGKSSVHTTVLVRYLSSMSKMGVRKRAEYSKVVLLLKQRPLTDFELLRVLGVTARHHVAAAEFAEQAARRLTELRERLYPIQRCLLLKYLGQGRSHNIFKAPRHRFLDHFLSKEEIHSLSAVSAVLALVGLVELRQYFNDAIPHLLAHLDQSVNLSTIQSTASLTELVAALLRLGWEESVSLRDNRQETSFSLEDGECIAAVVPNSLLVRALEVATMRLAHSRSLFADTTTLSLYWDLLHCGGDASTRHDSPVASAAHQFASTLRALLEARIQDIAESDNLSPNTFLISQLAIAQRFGVPFSKSALVDGGAASKNRSLLAQYVPRLAENIAYKDIDKLATNVREVPHAASTALAIADQKPHEAQKLLRCVLHNAPSLNANEAAALYRQLQATPDSKHVNVNRVIASLRESLRDILGNERNGSRTRNAWVRLAPHEKRCTLACYQRG